MSVTPIWWMLPGGPGSRDRMLLCGILLRQALAT